MSKTDDFQQKSCPVDIFSSMNANARHQLFSNSILAALGDIQ